jgi:hypothetical protein
MGAEPSETRGLESVDRLALTTKAPYVPGGAVGDYEAVPAGFEPVYTQMVCRHGTRTLAKPGVGERLVGLWQCAQAPDELTPLGRLLGPALQRFLDANAVMGYGQVTETGRLEMAGIAGQMVRRVPSLFRGAAAGEPQVEVVSATKQRAVDSASAFALALGAALPELAPHIPSVRGDDHLLYFHKSDKAYQHYARNDPRLAAANRAARERAETRAAATDLLSQSFTQPFIDAVARGDYSQFFADAVDAAAVMHSVWQVACGLSGEGDWELGQYVPLPAAAWFGYLDDLETFFMKGPAFAGEDITSAMASVLLDDVFAQFDRARSTRPSYAATLRFTHAEEIFPLATLLGLPGSDHAIHAGETFSYDNNTFRGALIAPMGANLQWDLFGDGRTHLVRLLHNEALTRFSATCRPVAEGSFWYDLDEINRAYGWKRSH